ncbi:MAG: 4-alpha-glucanotransferase [Bacteroidetes bacterium GWE2_39_28]|nr:MAG: 4-alpha-glucanotransferase [Bacteroidetes bacterium GWE2_39_28]OFY12645.1 MAG: 4-alpha-glucanotransferase [Bacteroidetes bacterium GWF2_39_10]OFZ06737.1 MAG: 4-alpha-glucanotransferase [Bacteroidetes bacterium RIFOXYB2_FULL_39_7]OFZ09637.1 MAG: 4-alpha-glucanotransferase [Bacteroidetes bacterium RIFOXYC2_FULL_39_11]HCT94640.1 4-alpha-glucanotransferase [Rikenellaceae bacterium]
MDMKVLMFGWEFPPHISGGLGTACYGLTKGLVNNDVEVLFVMPSATGDEDQTSVKIIDASDIEVSERCRDVKDFLEKVQFIRIGSNMIPYVDPKEFTEMMTHLQEGQIEDFKLGIGKKYKFSGKYGTNLMEEVARYALVAGEIAMRHDFDIIHAHDWLTYLAGIAAKRISGKPLVVHMHATEFDRSGQNINTEVYDIERIGMREADVVIAVSHLTRNIVINKYGINPEKVVTVHNAVDFQGFQNVQVDRGVPEKIVTFLGRITYQKGPEYFIEAAKKVIKNYPDVRFVMAGNGDLLNRCIRHVAKLRIADRFHFTGFLKGAEVKEMFAYSDVYVMPSVSEPFGISPLEAMRSNVPVIISKQSGVAEVLKHAIKVDFWDIDAMADSIYGLLSYPALSKMAVQNGLEEVNSLKWDGAAYSVKEIYSRLLKNKKK